MKERDIVINIESCMNNTMEVARSPDVSTDLGDGEHPVYLSRNAKNVGGVSPDLEEKNKKGNRMSMSAKKPPKPPRPPRGLSIDAADQKLITEISELLMIKRARIERMKALKRMKAAKASSASTSSSGNLIAILFTIFFCVVIIFQGCHPSEIWLMNHSANGIATSPKSNVATEDNIIIVQDQQNLTTSSVHKLSEVASPNVVKVVPGSGNQDGKAIY